MRGVLENSEKQKGEQMLSAEVEYYQQASHSDNPDGLPPLAE